MKEELDDKTIERIAKRIMLSMAFGREQFKNKVLEHLLGALPEFYKETLARRNGKVEWVEHWKTEWLRLIGPELRKAIRHETKFRDKNKAVAEVLEYLHKVEPKMRDQAPRILARDYKVPEKFFKKKLTDEDFHQFMEMVKAEVEAELEP